VDKVCERAKAGRPCGALDVVGVSKGFFQGSFDVVAFLEPEVALLKIGDRLGGLL
jgi:hypothetical protein